MTIDFEIHTDDPRGMYVSDFFKGGWDTIDAAREADNPDDADAILRRAYLGPDCDGVAVTWVIE